jgi:hypothetical protein
LLFEVLNGGEVVATSRTTIKAHRNWRGQQNSYEGPVTLSVPTVKLAGSRLRITMTTQDY